MDDGAFIEKFAALVRLGRYAAESEPVGVIATTPDVGGIFGFAISLDRTELCVAASQSGVSGVSPEPEPVDSILEHAQAFLPLLGDELRQWLTYAVAWDAPVRKLPDAAFCRLLETEWRRLPLLLGVPSVQDRIHKIRTTGSATQKKALARAIAGRPDGRRRVVPDDRVLYYEVSRRSKDLAPLIEKRSAFTNPAAARQPLQHKYPSLMAEIDELELTAEWFGKPKVLTRRPKLTRRTKLNAETAAYQMVAKYYGISDETVEKRVARVNARRRSKKSSGQVRRKPTV